MATQKAYLHCLERLVILQQDEPAPCSPKQLLSLQQPLSLQRSVSHLEHSCVIRAAANGELVNSKGNRNKACRLVEHQHTSAPKGSVQSASPTWAL